jgi:uncharacterized short protein YbdD (DUF466 family)
MTLLTISRTLPGWKPVDLEPITSVGLPPNEELEQKISRLTPKVSLTTDFEELHVTSKTGPQGLAMDHALLDLSLLPESGIAKHITTIGGETLKEVMNETFALLETLGPLTLTPTKGKTLRRLSVKKDIESKSRVFGILDYWSQTSLKRLHDELLTLLKTFKTDCTFDQGSRLGRIVPRSHFHSIDLSNATDRFPISLQVKVLTELIGETKAQAWAQIMTKLPFDHKGSPVAYARGQPMGAYSSWPMFALTHHLVVQYAASLVGKTNYSNYMLLGDDIVLGDDDVSTQYLDVLRQLDVPTSKAKTHVSLDTYEFAKRWVHRGEEVTGLSLQGIFDYSGPSSGLSFLDTLERVWSYSTQTLSRSDIASLINSVFPRPFKQRAHNVRLAASRIYDTLILPKGKIQTWTTGDNFLRSWETYHSLARGYLGCHVTIEHVYLALIQFIPMAKMAANQIAIKDTVRGLNRYRMALIKSLDRSIIEEMSSELPQLLLAHPAMRAGLAYARSAQSQLDRMDDLIGTGQEELILSEPPVLGFDPSNLQTKGKKELSFVIASKVPKTIVGLVKKYTEQKHRLLVGIDDPDEVYAIRTRSN